MKAAAFYRPELDVVRCCAFLAVFAHHTLPRDGVHGAALITFANSMGFGLCLFFVLSAYLITLLLLREQAVTGTVHLLAFYKRRTLRIWPLYLLGLSIGVLRAFNHGVLQEQSTWFVAALLLCGNLVYPGTILMSHLWSISLEEQFYLFFPSTCKSFGRRGVLSFAALLIVLANASLVHFAHIHAKLDSDVWFSTFVQGEMFAAGMLLALAEERLPRWNKAGSGVAALSALSLWMVAAGVWHLKTASAVASSALGVCFAYGLVAIGCCLLIVALYGLPSPRALVYSGRISYGLYVFHLPVIALLTGHFIANYTAGVLISLAVTYALAMVSYHYYEVPFLQIKRRYQLIPTRVG